MIVELKDLKKGDEVLVPVNSSLRWIKLLKTPVLRTNGNNRYKAVQCTFRQDIVTRTYKDYKGNIRNYQIKSDVCTPYGHNVKKSYDLNWKTLWKIVPNEKVKKKEESILDKI